MNNITIHDFKKAYLSNEWQSLDGNGKHAGYLIAPNGQQFTMRFDGAICHGNAIRGAGPRQSNEKKAEALKLYASR